MKRTSVESSSLAAVGYDGEISTLELQFRNGHCYQYFAVPQRVFQGLLAAPSKGAYVNKHIKGRFPFKFVHDQNSTQ
jgi:hypothetical protein